jgi:hypothetical protein
MKKILFFPLLFLFFPFTTKGSFSKESALIKDSYNVSILNDYVNEIYKSINFNNNKPSLEIFEKGIIGYLNFKKNGKLSDNNILTLIDFSLPSNEKRLWIIDLKNKVVLYNTLVAHGKNSGNIMAENFSNVANSYQSSLGFYITGEKYLGKHGLSMRLQGSDLGFNDNALKRAIVLHGADYVSEDFIIKNGRLGRSLGCPAIPMELTQEVVELTSNGTLLFIYKSNQDYEKSSSYLNQINAIEFLVQELSLTTG